MLKKEMLQVPSVTGVLTFAHETCCAQDQPKISLSPADECDTVFESTQKEASHEATPKAVCCCRCGHRDHHNRLGCDAVFGWPLWLVVGRRIFIGHNPEEFVGLVLFSWARGH